jgi:hypothetical protein
MKPRIIASSPEINMTTSRMRSSRVIGIGAQTLLGVARRPGPI